MKKIIITKSGMAINTDYIVEMHIRDHHPIDTIDHNGDKNWRALYSIEATLSTGSNQPLFSKTTTAEEIQTTYDEIIKFLVNTKLPASRYLILEKKNDLISFS